MSDTHVIKIRLKTKKLNSLNSKARKAGLSREEYCRRLFDGATVKEAPNADVLKLIYEMRCAGNNLNEVLKKANTVGFLDVPMLNKAVEDIMRAIRLVIDAYSSKVKS